MTGSGPGRRKTPNLATRTLIMLVAAAVVSAFGLVVVDLVTRPTPPGAAVQPDSGEEKMPLHPQVGEGLGELALQLALVAGIAFAGRRILKIRL